MTATDVALRSRLRVLAITNRHLCPGGLVEATRELIEGGVTAVMLREKDLPPRELYDLAVQLVPLCRRHGVLLTVNNSVEVALAAGADGAHLGGSAIPFEKARALAPAPFLLGYSAHEEADIVRAAAAGIDYCSISPIYYPTSKEFSTPPIGLEGLERCSKVSALPLVALGGITAQNAHECLEAGAAGVAAIGTLYGAPDRRAAAAEFAALFT